MGKRNPVKLVSPVVKRNNAVVTGNLCEANIPPTTISPLPIATRVIMTCKIVKAPTDIPKIIDGPVVNCSLANRRLCKFTLQLPQGFDQGQSSWRTHVFAPKAETQYSQGAGTQRKTSPATATWQTDGNDR